MTGKLLTVFLTTALTVPAFAANDSSAAPPPAPATQAAPSDQDDAVTPLGDCDPHVIRSYCASSSKCTIDEGPGAFRCKKAGKLVARIPKKKAKVIPQCRTLRYNIRKACH